MDVTTLGFANVSFDAIVSTFLFCGLDDQYQQPAIEELRRVCKPGGTIHILEYSISKNPYAVLLCSFGPRGSVMRIWPRLIETQNNIWMRPD